MLAAHKEKTTTSEAASGTRGIDPLRCAVTLLPLLCGTINFPSLGSFHSHWRAHPEGSITLYHHQCVETDLREERGCRS